MKDPAFSLPAYLEILDEFRAAGYRATSFTSGPPVGRQLLLRHDVDVSLGRANDLAQAERDADWNATYYVLVTSDLYNVHSSSSRSLLRSILSAGHEIGLHFDATVYGGADEANYPMLEAAAWRECAVLSDILGTSVASISFHRPVNFLQGLEGTFAGLPHAYQPCFFKDVEYCSDSDGAWNHGHPLSRQAIKTGQPMQFLTHPVWWIAEPNSSGPGKVDALLIERTEWLRSELARNIKSYAAYLKAFGR
jgi:hypothetical protein